MEHHPLELLLKRRIHVPGTGPPNQESFNWEEKVALREAARLKRQIIGQEKLNLPDLEIGDKVRIQDVKHKGNKQWLESGIITEKLIGCDSYTFRTENGSIDRLHRKFLTLDKKKEEDESPDMEFLPQPCSMAKAALAGST